MQKELTTLPPVMDLLAAGPLCAELRTKLSAGDALNLDGNAVQRISTPCLQILVAASRSAQARGTGFTLHNPSTALTDALTDLGLDPKLKF